MLNAKRAAMAQQQKQHHHAVGVGGVKGAIAVVAAISTGLKKQWRGSRKCYAEHSGRGLCLKQRVGLLFAAGLRHWTKREAHDQAMAEVLGLPARCLQSV